MDFQVAKLRLEDGTVLVTGAVVDCDVKPGARDPWGFGCRGTWDPDRREFTVRELWRPFSPLA